MGKMTACPGGCGATIDYDAVPSYSVARQRSGKFCPSCGFPLDEATAKADHLEYGPDSHKAMESRAEAAKGFYEESSTKPPTKEKAGTPK